MNLLILKCDLKILFLYFKMILDGIYQMNLIERKNIKYIYNNYLNKKKNLKKKKFEKKYKFQKIYFFK